MTLTKGENYAINYAYIAKSKAPKEVRGPVPPFFFWLIALLAIVGWIASLL